MAAVTVVNIHHGATPTVETAESGITFGRDDTVDSTTRIPKPTATGTAFSWAKSVRLRVSSGGGSTAISARTIELASAITAGLDVHFKNGGVSYAQATDVVAADSGSDDATPATYTKMTESAQSYDADSENAVDTTDNGDFLLLACGVDSSYAGGAGAAIALPSLTLTYTES